MKSQKLYYTKLACPQTLQILITAELSGVKIQLNEINKKYDLVNLVTKNGVLNKPNTILRYLTAGTALSGSTFQQRNQLNTWYEFFNTQLLPLLTELYGQVSGEKPANEQKYTYCINEVTKNLKVLDDSLKLKTFFAGNNIMLFDITLTCYLDNLFKLIVSQTERKKLTNLFRWYQYVRSIPIFTRHLGQISLCGKDLFKVDFNAPQKTQSKTQTQVKPQPKKQQKKNQNKKQPKTTKENKETKVQAKTQSQQNQQKPSQSAHQNKLDVIKESFKTSANQLETLTHFLENFNKEKLSIWKIQYTKGPQQDKQLASTQNLANGILQKAQNLNKVSFGTWGVYGEQGNYEVIGVMICEGTEIPLAWRQHSVFERLKFIQLSPSQDKTKIIDYLTEAKSVENLPLQSSQRIL